jgi:hypothetical protein
LKEKRKLKKKQGKEKKTISKDFTYHEVAKEYANTGYIPLRQVQEHSLYSIKAKSKHSLSYRISRITQFDSLKV